MFYFGVCFCFVLFQNGNNKVPPPVPVRIRDKACQIQCLVQNKGQGATNAQMELLGLHANPVPVCEVGANTIPVLQMKRGECRNSHPVPHSLEMVTQI